MRCAYRFDNSANYAMDESRTCSARDNRLTAHRATQPRRNRGLSRAVPMMKGEYSLYAGL